MFIFVWVALLWLDRLECRCSVFSSMASCSFHWQRWRYRSGETVDCSSWWYLEYAVAVGHWSWLENLSLHGWNRISRRIYRRGSFSMPHRTDEYFHWYPIHWRHPHGADPWPVLALVQVWRLHQQRRAIECSECVSILRSTVHRSVGRRPVEANQLNNERIQSETKHAWLLG